MLARRGFIAGLAAALAAPAVIRAPGLLMPVKPLVLASERVSFAWGDYSGTFNIPNLSKYGSSLTGAELAAVIRRAIIPRIFAEIYRDDMTQELLIRERVGLAA